MMTWTGLGYLVPYSLMATIILSWACGLDDVVGVNNTPIEIVGAAFLILILRIFRKSDFDTFINLKLTFWVLILCGASGVAFLKVHFNL